MVVCPSPSAVVGAASKVCAVFGGTVKRVGPHLHVGHSNTAIIVSLRGGGSKSIRRNLMSTAPVHLSGDCVWPDIRASCA